MAERYRKKPVVIEAMPYDGTPENIAALIAWGAPVVFDNPTGGPLRPYVLTLEGQMSMTPGDQIIRGVAGEFYPCKPDIFEQTYEKADD